MQGLGAVVGLGRPGAGRRPPPGCGSAAAPHAACGQGSGRGPPAAPWPASSITGIVKVNRVPFCPPRRRVRDRRRRRQRASGTGAAAGRPARPGHRQLPRVPHTRRPTPQRPGSGTTREGIVKLRLTAVFDAQHGGFETGWSPISWGSIDELFVNLTMPFSALSTELFA